jgi:hypothetical protein
LREEACKYTAKISKVLVFTEKNFRFFNPPFARNAAWPAVASRSLPVKLDDDQSLAD